MYNRNATDRYTEGWDRQTDNILKWSKYVPTSSNYPDLPKT